MTGLLDMLLLAPEKDLAEADTRCDSVMAIRLPELPNPNRDHVDNAGTPGSILRGKMSGDSDSVLVLGGSGLAVSPEAAVTLLTVMVSILGDRQVPHTIATRPRRCGLLNRILAKLCRKPHLNSLCGHWLACESSLTSRSEAGRRLLNLYTHM